MSGKVQAFIWIIQEIVIAWRNGHRNAEVSMQRIAKALDVLNGD